MKKILAMLLAFVLVFAAVPAMAKTTLETSVWMEELPNDNVSIPNVHEVLIEVEQGKYIYVIDQGTEITIPRALGAIQVVDGAGKTIFNTVTGVTSELVTVTYETAVRQDRSNVEWDDTVSAIQDYEYIKAGAKVRFNALGDFGVKLTAGFESMEERIEIQKASSAWTNIPVVYVQSVYAIDATIPALYTNAKVLVNGHEVAFEAYNIGDNNHFKLRDLAMALNGTEKQFAVSWDAAKGVIGLNSKTPYTPVGGELTVGDGSNKSCTPYRDGIVFSGASLDMQAFNIDGYNYFKLRDVCKLFDIYVGWDGAANTITIDTSKSYVAE